jgi:hypothetical protein
MVCVVVCVCFLVCGESTKNKEESKILNLELVDCPSLRDT